MCTRPAPSASRSEISFCRDVVRARSRLATFAQAISRTTPTIDISTTSGVENSRRRSDTPFCAWQHVEMLRDEALAERLPTRRDILDLLLVDLPVDHVHRRVRLLRVTPGFSRAMTVTQRLRRLSRSFHVGVICAFIISGTMTSAAWPTCEAA